MRLCLKYCYTDRYIMETCTMLKKNGQLPSSFPIWPKFVKRHLITSRQVSILPPRAHVLATSSRTYLVLCQTHRFHEETPRFVSLSRLIWTEHFCCLFQKDGASKTLRHRRESSSNWWGRRKKEKKTLPSSFLLPQQLPEKEREREREGERERERGGGGEDREGKGEGARVGSSLTSFVRLLRQQKLSKDFLSRCYGIPPLSLSLFTHYCSICLVVWELARSFFSVRLQHHQGNTTSGHKRDHESRAPKENGEISKVQVHVLL